MYIPPSHLPDEWSDILGFIKKYNFATLISKGESNLVATHLPFNVLAENETYFLQGHLSKANPQFESIVDQEVMVIFMAGHHYISPSWYNHRNVPTWNYIAIHVYGKCKRIEGERLLQHLDSLMNYHEQIVDFPQEMKDIPKNIFNKDLKGLYGIEIQIDRIEAAYKLSQNRDDESYQNVIKSLEKINTDHSNFIAIEMKKRR